MGSFIDSFDVVVELMNWNYKDYFIDYGSRTNVAFITIRTIFESL